MADRKNVTQNDVAKLAGVTRSMVSYVISNSTDRSVAPETRKRILDAIDELGYRPNKAAQTLQCGKKEMAKNQIGVVICNADVFRRPYYAEIIAGIHTAAHEHRYHVHFIRFFEEFKDPVLFNELVHDEEIGSLILISTDQCIKTNADAQIVKKMRERIRKIVCIEWKFDGLSSVVFDRQETAKKACAHLFYKGYDDVAYIGEIDDRVTGVKTAFMETGKNLDELKFILPAFDMPGGYDAIKNFAKNNSLPRAFVCGSDEVAIGVLCYLNEQKIAVPEQVALISIDNLESSGYTNPPLTTMNVQKSAMGERAVNLIVTNENLQDDNAICLSLPSTLVNRKSC